MPIPDFKARRRLLVSLGLGSAIAAVPVHAQDTHTSPPVGQAEPETGDPSTYDGDEIIVTAIRPRGGVDTDVPPVDELDADDVASYGAASIDELLDALGPQTGSARGRGGGRPVVLLNGRRISGFRELRDLPPEAIERVQIFPEEVALEYGFRPDHRVVNIILKENFASVIGKFEAGAPGSGGFYKTETEATLTRIGRDSRLNVDVEYEHNASLTEAERDILQPTPDAQTVLPAGIGDVGRFRTLRPETDRFEINATWSRNLSPTTIFSLNGNYQVLDGDSLNGLASARFHIPGGSPFSQTGADSSITRLFAEPRALTRSATTHTAQAGATLNGRSGDWRWSLTGNYARIDSETNTARSIDSDALQAGIAAGTIDPFDPAIGAALRFREPDRTDSLNQTASATATTSGSLFSLPAGDVRLSLNAGYSRLDIDGRSIRSGLVTATDLGRSVGNGMANIAIPIASRREGVLDFLGDFSFNANVGYSELSDFGGLISKGGGFNWEPVEGLTLLFSYIGEEAAPLITDLGNPLIVTPNVTTFDFTRGESVLIDRITGGNPALLAESRDDLKFNIGWQPGFIDNLRIETEYLRNRSDDVTSSFPLLTPEIEAAFPDRVVRDASGRLVSVDARPVNFSATRSDRIRTGFNLRGRIGADQERGGGEGRGAERGGGRGLPGSLGRGRNGGRWQASLYHTYRLKEEVVIRPELPVLDLLDGSATSGNGVPRHQLELRGGGFYKGMGFRASANYQSATRVGGNDMTGDGDLVFGDLATVDLRFFVNLEQIEGVTKALPFLEGSRISLRIDNVFDGIQDVRDAAGLVPLSFQPGFVDPVGRYFEIDFRKRF